MLIKIEWKLNGMTHEKAGVPQFWKVPEELRGLTRSQLKSHLMLKFCYDIKKIEVIY